MKYTFTVPSSGWTVNIKPVSAEIMRVLNEEQSNFPKPPTYETSLAGGEVERFPHDDTTEKTPEEQAAWDAYEAARDAATMAWEQRWMRALILLGLDDPEQDEGWERQMEYIGVSVPEDELDRKVFYVNNFLLPTDEDKAQFSEAVSLITRVGRDDLERIQAEFPGALPWRVAEERGVKPVGLQDIFAFLRSPRDGAVGDPAESVGQTEPV